MSYVFIVNENGRLPEGAKHTLARIIPEYAGKTVELDLHEYKPTTSDKQRKYYFATIVAAFQDYFAKQGKRYTSDQMHDQLMRAIGGFSNPYVNAFTGEEDAGRMSIHALTKTQGEGYFELCRKWLAEHGIDCPEPNETEYWNGLTS